jgi:hypothetical protein
LGKAGSWEKAKILKTIRTIKEYVETDFFGKRGKRVRPLFTNPKKLIFRTHHNNNPIFQ